MIWKETKVLCPIFLCRTIKLYKIEDSDVTVVSESRLTQDMLESDVSIILSF